MAQEMTLSAIGRDRPGIVAGLTGVLFEQGCNLEDSSMTRLGGDFAVLLLVALPEGLTPDALTAALAPTAQTLGLTIALREAAARGDGGGLPYTLVVYGADRPGIVFRVTEAAAGHGINICDLRSHVTSGAHPIDSLVMELSAPSAEAATRFGDAVRALARELAVYVSFGPMEADEL